MATARIDTGGVVTTTSTKNNRATLRMSGTSARVNVVGNGLNGVYTAATPITATSGIVKSVVSGNLNKMLVGKYTIRRVTNSIAGVANTTLVSGGSDFGQRRVGNFTNKDRGTFLQSYSWTTDNSGTPIEITYTGVNRDINVTYGTDKVTTNKLGSPGQITIKTAAPKATTQNYRT